MNRYRVGVMFCGACNCYYDRDEFYYELKKNMEGICEFVYFSTDSKEKCDLILLINACQSECLMTGEYDSKKLLINNKNYKIAEELIKKELKILSS